MLPVLRYWWKVGQTLAESKEHKEIAWERLETDSLRKKICVCCGHLSSWVFCLLHFLWDQADWGQNSHKKNNEKSKIIKKKSQTSFQIRNKLQNSTDIWCESWELQQKRDLHLKSGKTRMLGSIVSHLAWPTAHCRKILGETKIGVNLFWTLRMAWNIQKCKKTTKINK